MKHEPEQVFLENWNVNVEDIRVASIIFHIKDDIVARCNQQVFNRGDVENTERIALVVRAVAKALSQHEHSLSECVFCQASKLFFFHFTFFSFPKNRKKWLKELSEKLYPNIKVTYNVSDAILIANYSANFRSNTGLTTSHGYSGTTNIYVDYLANAKYNTIEIAYHHAIINCLINIPVFPLISSLILASLLIFIV